MILLFQSWVLDTTEKFIIACVGVIIFGNMMIWIMPAFMLKLRGVNRRITLLKKECSK